MIINHNMSAIDANRNLWQNTFHIGKVQEKLASGLRINRAADDAAGLAISSTMRAQIRGLDQANRNAQDAVSLIQTADGALQNTSNILARMRELAVQAANDTYTSNDRQQMQKEIDQLKLELDRTANTTTFNNKNLLDGSASALVSADNINTDVYVRGSLIDSLGVSHAGSYKIAVNFNAVGACETMVSNVMVDRNTNLVATATIQLRNVAQFYDNNGRFIIDNPQTVTLVQGNGNKTSFTIYDNDTMSGIADKFAKAICTTAGLGQSVVYNTSADFCTLTMSNAVTASAENASGSFVLRSAMAGDDGTITIVADQAVLNAFGFSDFKAAVQTSYTVTIFNANTGAQMLQTNLKGNAALGLVYNNVDVKFDSKFGLSSNYVASQGCIVAATATVATGITTIHMVDNSQTFQIGSNEKQNMNSAIGNMRSDALGVDNLLVGNINVAGASITKIDMAYARVSEQRSYLGAIQNRLETTMSNLQVGSENIQAAESRIRDENMAEGMMEFTRLNILTQAATAMLAQANTQGQSALQLLGR